MNIVSEATVMPPFRERLGTGCTKDSKDSGIDVQQKKQRSRTRRLKKTAQKKCARLEKEEENNNEDSRQALENTIVIGLWLIVLYFTNLVFGLPFEIMRPVKVNHVLVAISYFFITIWALFAFHFYLKKSKKEERWFRIYPKTCFISWSLLICGMFLFYVATFPQLHNWSLSIIGFYFVFFATLTSTFL